MALNCRGGSPSARCTAGPSASSCVRRPGGGCLAPSASLWQQGQEPQGKPAQLQPSGRRLHLQQSLSCLRLVRIQRTFIDSLLATRISGHSTGGTSGTGLSVPRLQQHHTDQPLVLRPAGTSWQLAMHADQGCRPECRPAEATHSESGYAAGGWATLQAWSTRASRACWCGCKIAGAPATTDQCVQAVAAATFASTAAAAAVLASPCPA